MAENDKVSEKVPAAKIGCGLAPDFYSGGNFRMLAGRRGLTDSKRTPYVADSDWMKRLLLSVLAKRDQRIKPGDSVRSRAGTISPTKRISRR